jgi:uncharacterized protein (TIGR02231 family)
MTSKTLLFLIFPALLMVLPREAAAAEKEKFVNSTISEVTVYLQGAQVTREGKADIGAGVTKLIFDELSGNIDQKSIQATVTQAGVTLISVHHQVNYIKNQELPPSIKIIQDSIDVINYLLEVETAKMQTLQDEQSMILENKKVGGLDKGLVVAELEDAALFFRKRLGEIKLEMLQIRSRQKFLNGIIGRFNTQIQDFNNKVNEPSYEIVVSLKSDRATTVNAEISYYVSNASWSPVYDLRAHKTQGPIQLFYKANITQFTGEFWGNVKLTLSTGNPTLGGTTPVLNTWFLDFYNPQVYSNYEGAGRRSNSSYGTYDDKAQAPAPREQREKDVFKPPVTTVQMDQNALATEFTVSLPVVVPSDNQPHMIDVQSYNLNAEYSHYAVPKFDRDAFLLAKIIGWDTLNLLSGPVNIFLEGSYTGESYIDAKVVSDTLNISMGRDKKVVITRVKLQQLCSKSFTGGSIKDNLTWEIFVRNTKNEPITILLEDQIPVANNKEIEVTLEDAPEAIYDKETGRLKWLITLPASSSKNIRFSYQVKYPKDKAVGGL